VRCSLVDEALGERVDGHVEDGAEDDESGKKKLHDIPPNLYSTDVFQGQVLPEKHLVQVWRNQRKHGEINSFLCGNHA
jgi:hypothetical protein